MIVCRRRINQAVVFRKYIAGAWMAIWVLLPWQAFAYSNDINSDKLTSILNALVDLVTSTPAKILFVLSIIGVGYSTLALGKMNKGRAIGVVMGIGIVFSSGYIAQQLGLGT